MIVATARQSLLAFTIVLPRSDSSKIPGNVEADDGLRRNANSTEQCEPHTTPLSLRELPYQVGP